MCTPCVLCTVAVCCVYHFFCIAGSSFLALLLSPLVVASLFSRIVFFFVCRFCGFAARFLLSFFLPLPWSRGSFASFVSASTVSWRAFFFLCRFDPWFRGSYSYNNLIYTQKLLGTQFTKYSYIMSLILLDYLPTLLTYILLYTGTKYIFILYVAKRVE